MKVDEIASPDVNTVGGGETPPSAGTFAINDLCVFLSRIKSLYFFAYKILISPFFSPICSTKCIPMDTFSKVFALVVLYSQQSTIGGHPCL